MHMAVKVEKKTCILYSNSGKIVGSRLNCKHVYAGLDQTGKTSPEPWL